MADCSAGCAAVPSGYAGNLNEAQTTALQALKSSLQEFVQKQERSTGSTAKKQNAGPTGSIQPGTAAEEAAEARTLLSSNADMLRFLRARDFNVAKTLSMAVDNSQWRASVKPQAITPEMLPNALPSGCMSLCGHAKSGMPIICFDAAKWNPSVYYSIDEMVRNVAYFLDAAVARMAPGVERFLILFLLGGFTFEMTTPFATRCALQLVSITQNQYPERLGIALLCRAPWIFHPLWKAISPFINPKTRNNVHFINDIPNDALLELVDREVLVADVGGTHPAYQLCSRPLPAETKAYFKEIGGRENLPALSDMRAMVGIAGAKSILVKGGSLEATTTRVSSREIQARPEAKPTKRPHACLPSWLSYFSCLARPEEASDDERPDFPASTTLVNTKKRGCPVLPPSKRLLPDKLIVIGLLINAICASCLALFCDDAFRSKARMLLFMASEEF